MEEDMARMILIIMVQIFIQVTQEITMVLAPNLVLVEVVRVMAATIMVGLRWDQMRILVVAVQVVDTAAAVVAALLELEVTETPHTLLMDNQLVEQVVRVVGDTLPLMEPLLRLEAVAVVLLVQVVLLVALEGLVIIILEEDREVEVDTMMRLVQVTQTQQQDQIIQGAVVVEVEVVLIIIMVHMVLLHLVVLVVQALLFLVLNFNKIKN
jgi:hypothetical protein